MTDSYKRLSEYDRLSSLPAGALLPALYQGRNYVVPATLILGDTYEAGDFGIAVANTGTANVAALKTAIAAISAAGGGTLLFPPGSLSFTLIAADSIAWGDGVYLKGAGMRATVLDFSSNADYSYNNGIFIMQGTGRSQVKSVTADVARGALVATVADTTGIASGDIVQLRSTENYVVSDGGTRAEFLRVRYTDATHIYFTTPTVEVYATGAGTVQLAKMTFATGGVSDLTLKGKGSNPLGWPTPDRYTSTAEVNDSAQNTRSDYGFEMRFCRDMVFSRVRFVDVENQPIYFQACYGGEVEGCVFEFSAIQERSQYGVAVYRGSSNIRIANNFCVNCRHFVTTGSTSSTSSDWFFGVPTNVTVVGNTVLGSWQDGIDLHRSGFNFTIIGNVVQGYYAGIKTRGQKCIIANNVVYGPNNTDAQSSYDGIQVQFNDNDVSITGNIIFGHACGIRVSSTDANASNLLIQNNECYGSQQYGIRVTTDAHTVSRVKIEGNLVDSPLQYGIYPDGNFTDLSVKNNTINGGSYGIRTPATGTRVGVDVSGNVIRGTTNDPIYLELCNSITVNGNQLFGANANGVHMRLRDCKRGTVTGNHVVLPSGSSGGNGIYVNCTGSAACTDLAIDANQVYSSDGVGTGIAFDGQANQFHIVGGSNNCRTCATPIATDTGASIRNEAIRQSSKTIASDAITVEAKSGQMLIVDTEAAAAADNLSTINYTGRPGDTLVLRINNAARVVTFKDNTGNLRLASDYAPTSVDSMLSLVWGGAVWSETGRSSN